MRGILIIMGVITLLVVSMFVLDPTTYGGKSSEAVPAPAPVTQQYVLSYTPDEIVAEYDRNTVSADERLKGKVFKVFGQLTNINTDASGAPYVTMKTSKGDFVEPVFKFKSGQQGIGMLSKGRHIELTCIGAGDVLKIPVARDCVF